LLKFARLVAAVALIASTTAHAAVDRPTDPSEGNPRILTVLSGDGLGDLSHGVRLTKLCSVRSRRGDGAYDLYQFNRLTQAAIQVHGTARIVAISASGHLLGSYDDLSNGVGRCLGGRKLVRRNDDGASASVIETKFVPGELPASLADGQEFFARGARIGNRQVVDGVKLPATFSGPARKAKR
jgi:hypothetical protein